MPRSPHRHRPRVLIAGGGVAGLKTLLALHALSGDLLEITILAPELKFINRSMSVEEPFKPQRVRGLRLQKTAVEFGARWHQGTLDRVEPERRLVVTTDGDELPYDRLVLALGAHPEREWHSPEVLTYHGGRDGPTYRLLLHQLLEGRVKRLAFVKPGGTSWPLPLYDLALMTAAECAAHDRSRWS
jgi:sulfide:quinone oxidoreductase